jgi:hypothetical protein
MTHTAAPTHLLPDTPSRLIRLALADLEACEQDPQYRIVMEYWHLPTQTGCCVCLAGAVLAQTLKVPPSEGVHPGMPYGDFYAPGLKRDTESKLLALDRFRAGDIKAGLDVMGFETVPTLPRGWLVPYYNSDPLGFKMAMADIARTLEQEGL